MRMPLFFLIFVLVFNSVLYVFPQSVQAEDCTCTIESVTPNPVRVADGAVVNVSNFNCDGNPVNNRSGFEFWTDFWQPGKDQATIDIPASAISNGTINGFSLILDDPNVDGPQNNNFWNAGRTQKLVLRRNPAFGETLGSGDICQFQNISVYDDSCSISIDTECDPNGLSFQYAYNINTGNMSPGRDYSFWIYQSGDSTPSFAEAVEFRQFTLTTPGALFTGRDILRDPGAAGRTYDVFVSKTDSSNINSIWKHFDNKVPGCFTQIQFPTDGCTTDPLPIPTDPPLLSQGLGVGICEQVGADFIGNCSTCVGTDPKNPAGIWTAVGCIPTTAEGIVQNFMTLAIGLAGGLTVLFTLFGSFIISTSTGNPDRLKSGQQMIVAAISGVVFILFSVILLQVIGVEILRIPGFFN